MGLNRSQPPTGPGGESVRRARQRQRRATERQASRRLAKVARLKMYSLVGAVVVLLIGGLVVASVRGKTLPPTSFGPGHSEQLPSQQINFSPIPRPIQEHVMERTPGHPPGRMLVQYNCAKYECAPELVQTLESIVAEFPPTVYLAPYPGMDAKIALAAPGRLEILNELDADRIRDFIRVNLNR